VIAPPAVRRRSEPLIVLAERAGFDVHIALERAA